MLRLRLSTLLIGLNVGLLLLAVTGVAFSAVRLLRQLGDEQALARVMQAGQSAEQVIAEAADDLLTTAQLLGDRPTLRRLVLADDRPALSAFLTQFQQTSQIDGCSVLFNDAEIARSGDALPWSALDAPTTPGVRRLLYRQPDDGALVMGAQAPVTALPGGRVGVTLRLDERVSRTVSQQVGLPVTIIDQPGALAAATPQLVALRRQVLGGATAAAARLDAEAVYLAIMPLRAPDGAVIGLIETRLPATGVDQSVRQLVETLLLLALSVAGLAALVSFLVGRRLGRPLALLTRAAARIGGGDLTTPIPLPSVREIGALAASLEEMRRHLLQLTADLRRQRAEAQAIITGIVEGVFTVDRERRIRYINPQAAALLGITPEAAIGRFCGDVLNPQGSSGARPCADQCPIIHARFRGGARATERLLLHDGQRRTVVITSAPPTEDQQVQVIRDETEVEATRRLRDAVLANISHEFRTPLAAQLASIELLLDQLPTLTRDQIGELVIALQRGSLRLTQLIDNLLESVRIEAGQDRIRRQPVALDQVVEAALELMRPLLDQRGQETLVDLPYPLPLIDGDSARLTQVFVNLLANANKFAPAGSVIMIGGTVQPAHVTLWVEDQGPGLPPMADQALFERFVRAPAEEPEQSGMGLGLWIVKSIIERHNGRVTAQNAAAGARMCVTLPWEHKDEDTGS